MNSHKNWMTWKWPTMRKCRKTLQACVSVFVIAAWLATSSTTLAAPQPPCLTTSDSYVPCLESLVLTLDTDLQHERARVGLLEQRLLLRDEQIRLLTEDRTQLSAALVMSRDANAQAVGAIGAWYNSPYLWLGLGLFLGAGLTIGVGVAASQAWRR